MADLGIKVGKDYSEEELRALEDEAVFGKLYARALEYCMSRPHSIKEVRDYLWRKTLTTKYKSRTTGEVKERPGVAQPIADRVLDRLIEKGYLNDEQFARWWVDNRNQIKGVSRRKLQAELASKGVAREAVEQALQQTTRQDEDELMKIIVKKQNRYPERNKLVAYLARQGFSYEDIATAIDKSITD